MFIVLLMLAVERLGAVAIFRKNHSKDELTEAEKKKYRLYIFTAIFCIIGACLMAGAYVWYAVEIMKNGFFEWNIIFDHVFPRFPAVN